MTTKETGFYSDVMKALKKINGTRIDVGYFEGDNYTRRKIIHKNIDKPINPPIPMANVAFWLDKGTTRIPERPFLSPLFVEQNLKYRKLSREYAFEVLSGRWSIDKMMKRLGSLMISDVKLKMTEIRVPPNSPEWQKIKGFDNPLILNGWLRANTKFKVHK